MTLPAETTETAYNLAGANLGPFATVWTCNDPSEISVTLNIGGLSTVISGGGVDYSVSGGPALTAGLNVTLLAHNIPGGGAWPANCTLALRRVSLSGQPSAFGEALGFSPSASEQALDAVARQAQDLFTRTSRCLRAQPGEHLNPLPNAKGRASSIPWFEADGSVTAGQLQYVSQPEVGPGAAYLATVDDGLTTLGRAGHRWSTVYAVTGAINTSDARAKQDIGPISNALLDAWADVEFMQFRLIAEAQAQGAEAKLHVGVIAQQIVKAFAARGLDAVAYGVVTHDRWEACADAPAGDAYGVRYDEAMVLEAALMRRELRRLCDRP
ncbi:tail fiber domain-containing protein [Phenylobacterium sp.]|uniref:tail fiber domain-containing protein n=1 Tax=Phenylobacterium sp. TaxID=1871053 RepID=UPI002DE8FBB8|nr:tail fiber domain-containing protein [Phenylobacterium sp.]